MSDAISIDELWENLTDSEKEAWTQIQTTLGSPGFKLIERDLTEIGDRLADSIWHVQSWDQYIFVKGQINALGLLVNLQDRVLAQLQQAVSSRTPDPLSETPLEVPEDFA